MADLRTEEEQIDAIKNWWKENGRSTVLGVTLAVVAVFGWRTWQTHEQNQAENASLLYQNFSVTVQVQPGEALPEERKATAVHLAGQLKSEFSGSTYAQYAALWLAKAAVDAGDLATARSELQWVVEQKPDTALQQVVTQRLARVLAAEGELDQALVVLGAAPATGFEASFFEIKGDVLLQQGNLDAARQAYQQGVERAGDQPRPILTMKLDDLAATEGS